MKTTEDYLEEIKEIRKIMEQSGRFLSLSGLSGILIGVYAIAGALLVSQIIYPLPASVSDHQVFQIITIAAVVLFVSLVTTIWLTWKKAEKTGKGFWNRGSRQMLINLAIPFISGGVLIFMYVLKQKFEIVVPASLIFYGLALINASKFTRQEIFYLGILEILIGLLAAAFAEISLILWAFGFGVLHIIYGALMYFRYEKPFTK